VDEFIECFGVDFSGAKHPASKLWIARLAFTPSGMKIHLRDVICIADRVGRNAPPDVTYAALRDLLTADLPLTVTRWIGMDFPFSLPRALIAQDSWTAFAHSFADTYPTADALYHAGRAFAHEPRRDTDRESRPPFAPTNLRMYRQTYYGIRDVLAPLSRDPRVAIFPLHGQDAHAPITLFEICPSLTLPRLAHALGLHKFAPYKGKTAAHAANRADIVDRVIEQVLSLRTTDHDALRERLIADAEGDGIDAILAGIDTWACVSQVNGLRTHMSENARIEGNILTAEFPR
jgi:hypothetical protein